MSFIRKIRKGDKVYLAEVESKWVNGKSVQKHIRYIGREVDGQQVLSSSISDIEIKDVKVYGPLVILHELAKEIGLHRLLGEYHNELLSLVYAHCLEPTSINQMSRWFERTDLNVMLALEGLTEARLLKALDSLEERAPEVLQRDIFEAVRKKYPVFNKGIVYDVTNTYFYGKKCPLGKRGYSKDNQRDKALVQIGLAVTRQHGIPVFHKVYEGNIHDARTLQDIMVTLRKFTMKPGIFVYDRGVASAANISEITGVAWDVLCAVPIKGKIIDVVKQLQDARAFVDIKKRVKLSRTVYYVISQGYGMGGVKGRLLVCYNDHLAREIREARYDEIMKAQDLLRADKPIKSGLYQYFDKHGGLKKRVIAQAERFDGFSCLFVTKRLSSEEVVRIYYEKDIVEKAFRTLKGIIQIRPIRHWLYARVIAHIFICYLAYLLLSLLRYKLLKLGMNPCEALQEMATMYKIYMRDRKKNFKLAKVVKYTRKQEQILKAVNKQLLKT